MPPTTQHRIFIRAIMAVLVAVAQEVGAGAVSIIALKPAQWAVATGAGGGLIRAVSAVPLAVTLPPDGDAAVKGRKGNTVQGSPMPQLYKTKRMCVSQ